MKRSIENEKEKITRIHHGEYQRRSVRAVPGSAVRLGLTEVSGMLKFLKEKWLGIAAMVIAVTALAVQLKG